MRRGVTSSSQLEAKDGRGLGAWLGEAAVKKLAALCQSESVLAKKKLRPTPAGFRELLPLVIHTVDGKVRARHGG